MEGSSQAVRTRAIFTSLANVYRRSFFLPKIFHCKSNFARFQAHWYGYGHALSGSSSLLSLCSKRVHIINNFAESRCLSSYHIFRTLSYRPPVSKYGGTSFSCSPILGLYSLAADDPRSDPRFFYGLKMKSCLRKSPNHSQLPLRQYSVRPSRMYAWFPTLIEHSRNVGERSRGWRPSYGEKHAHL